MRVPDEDKIEAIHRCIASFTRALESNKKYSEEGISIYNEETNEITKLTLPNYQAEFSAALRYFQNELEKFAHPIQSIELPNSTHSS